MGKKTEDLAKAREISNDLTHGSMYPTVVRNYSRLSALRHVAHTLRYKYFEANPACNAAAISLSTMSRASTHNGTQLRQQSGEDGELHHHLHSLDLNSHITSNHADPSDICPVCKSARYLNPNMRFLINPECYHKMCESCVDRIFSQGPAPCPIAGCARTLRKNKFRVPKFEDLQIEREVDVRKRIAKMYALFFGFFPDSAGFLWG